MRRLFAVEEIEESPRLQAIFWILLTIFLVSFESWRSVDDVTKSAARAGRNVCPTYFQDCHRLYFLDVPPHSYSQDLLYTLLGGLLVISAYLAWRKDWTSALIFFLPALTWKILYVFVLTYNTKANYEYFHIPAVLLFLFARDKIKFMRFTLALTYMLCATVKFREAWLTGKYFSSLSLGLPLVPTLLVPAVTIGVTLFETVTPLLLFSVSDQRRKTGVYLWTAFHLYSIAFVGYQYPSYCLPLLWALFLGGLPSQVGNSSRKWLGYGIMALLLVGGALSRLHNSEWSYTLSRKKFSPAMFPANYQCYSEAKFYRSGHEIRGNINRSSYAMRRCEPYPSWYRLRRMCKIKRLDKVSWRFVSSVNGGPFYELVSTDNVCDLTYLPFGRNAWIRTPATGATIVGYPRPNTLGPPSISNKDLISPHPVIVVSDFQQWLSRHLSWLKTVCWAIWIVCFLALVRIGTRVELKDRG
ncbi:MAG: hypothetical protein AB7F86_20320 [Bdellovibrionales bacterium]